MAVLVFLVIVSIVVGIIWQTHNKRKDDERTMQRSAKVSELLNQGALCSSCNYVRNRSAISPERRRTFEEDCQIRGAYFRKHYGVCDWFEK